MVTHITRKALGGLSQAVLAAVSLVIAFELRFEFAIPAKVIPVMVSGLLIAIPLKVAAFYLGRFHRRLRVHARIPDLFHLLGRSLAASCGFAAVALCIVGRQFPRSVYLIDFLLSFVAMEVIWFSAAGSQLSRWRRPGKPKRILIYGAGWAGATLLHETRVNHSISYEVAGFLDDDPAKSNAEIMGVRVLGAGIEAASVIERLSRDTHGIEEVVIAIPSATAEQKRQAAANCMKAGIRCKTIPGIAELLEREVLVSQIRDLSLTDLLGRPAVELAGVQVAAHIKGRCVLVTGAAGSIGSELCRQLARLQPSPLIVLDQAESDLFRIEHELRDTHPDLDLVVALGDIRNPQRLRELFERYRIDSVFHAAAYKHVPMMESHILEAVENNTLGTWNLIRAVQQHAVPRFLMISSDKAVNPTSVMGATKRACEFIVASARDRSPNTTCVSVRFGNVLGSNGSVVPVFQAQIASGGPVRVTHPDIQRYFMTTREAVALALEAFSMGTGSELFVLDMGNPIRIVDLASHMIRLAGLVPYKDIDIQFTGLRPGEKLFEEINCAGERMLPTSNEKIRIFQQSKPDASVIEAWIERLRVLVNQRRDAEILDHLQQLVPEYRPSNALPTRAVAAPQNLEQVTASVAVAARG